jgi:hypothetical protein
VLRAAGYDTAYLTPARSQHLQAALAAGEWHAIKMQFIRGEHYWGLHVLPRRSSALITGETLVSLGRQLSCSGASIELQEYAVSVLALFSLEKPNHALWEELREKVLKMVNNRRRTDCATGTSLSTCSIQ